MLRTARIITILTAVVLVSVAIWQRFLDPDVPVKKLTRAMEREIPAGSTKARIYEFLEAEHFAFSGYNVGPDPLYGLPEARRERKRYVTARIPVRGVIPYFGDYDIRLVFYFDEEELLSAYELQQLYDGP